MLYYFFFFKQKTAYEMRISDWSSDVCSSDLSQPRSQRGSDAARKATRTARMCWCPRGDSNPHDLSRYHLKVVRLPIPPPRQCISSKPASLQPVSYQPANQPPHCISASVFFFIFVTCHSIVFLIHRTSRNS